MPSFKLTIIIKILFKKTFSRNYEKIMQVWNYQIIKKKSKIKIKIFIIFQLYLLVKNQKIFFNRQFPGNMQKHQEKLKQINYIMF